MELNRLFLTGNTDTIYCMVFLDLETDGPTVVEIPPGCGPGTVDDAFFRFVIDMGAGQDRIAARAANTSSCPPDYRGKMPKDRKDGSEYFVAQSTLYVNWVPLRGFLVDGKTDAAVKMFREGLKVYPLSQAANPPKMEFIRGSKVPFNTVHANNFEFYEELDHVIQKEPVGFLDPELRRLAASIGIVNGKKLAPDARLKKILADAVPVGSATARAISKRDKLITKTDGSVELCFGPQAPAGKEANWIATVLKKGWFVIFRLYGPPEPWFEKTWRPGEIELVK